MQSDRRSRRVGTPARPETEGGFTLIELLMASVILVACLLAIANMMPTGHTNITDAGKRTMALTAARQILEDMRSVPYGNLLVLNGFDTNSAGTLPDGSTNPTEQNLARRWRYTLAGDAPGFDITPMEQATWTPLFRGVATASGELGGRAQVSVANFTCPFTHPGCQLRVATVVITFPGREGNLTLETRIARP